MENKKGITLIGMPCSGKSTVGKILAKNLSWRFIDLDDYIKLRTGRGHADILAEKGDAEFIKFEGNLALELDFRNMVFSPGGSLVYSDNVMGKIRFDSKIIYLFLPVSEIRKRLGDTIGSRGIVGLKEKDLDGIFSERDPLYRFFSDRVIDCSGLDKNDIVNLLINYLSE